MKRSLLTILFSCLLACTVVAQPSWTKKAGKSVFTLKTFDAGGNLLGSSVGFYTGQQGEAVSSYAPLRGAVSARVIGADGKELPVERILGANETYDVAKFRVAVKKSVPLTVASAPASVASKAWLLPYRETKKVPQGVVRKVETVGNGHHYYTLALQMPAETVGAPLLNEQGEVLALMQQPMKQGDSLSYAVSARYADSLTVTGLSINDPVLRAIGIRKALPTDLGQAQLSLYVGSASLDSLAYSQLVNDFIEQFPQAPDGYQYRASLAVSAGDFASAQRDMEQAINVAADKAEAHHSYSRLILQKEVLKADQPFEPWSLDVALQEARTAYEMSQQPIYKQQQAQVLFAQKNYEQAAQTYLELTQTPLRSPELFYEAARCKGLLADTTAQLALLDSTVAQFSRPYLKEAAPYLLARAQARLNMNRFRDAYMDLNEYETLLRSQLNANFYYLRYQACVGGRLFQQGLNDINRAIELAPDEPFYYAEKASLQLRVALYADAIETARRLIELQPAQSDGYLFLGLAQCMSNQKAEGLKNLEKARDMGDPQAAGFIEKYAK